MSNSTPHNIDVLHYREMVSGPGKFEGADALAAYLYDQSMDGEILADQEEDGHWAALFTLQGDEPAAFDREHGERVVLVEDSQGFVYTMTEAQYASWK